MAFVDIYFSLGSNLGDRRGNILRGLEGLDKELGTTNRAISKLIESKPQGFKSRNDFINCCARYRVYREEDTILQCERILDLCKRLESEAGREDHPLFDKDGNRIYQDRQLDIDILFFGKDLYDKVFYAIRRINYNRKKK